MNQLVKLNKKTKTQTNKNCILKVNNLETSVFSINCSNLVDNLFNYLQFHVIFSRYLWSSNKTLRRMAEKKIEDK